MRENAHQSICQVFSETAARAVESFAGQLGSLYLGTPHADIYESPDAAQVLKKGDWQLDGFINALKGRLHRDVMVSGITRDIDIGLGAGRNFNIILFPDGIYREGKTNIFVSPRFRREMDLASILAHEIGHRIVPEGHVQYVPNAGHINECAADAYALLWHIQHYGDATDVFAYFPFTRARMPAHFSRAHYTAAISHKIEKLNREMDVAALSPQETVALAGKIARDYALPHETLCKIEGAFRPLGEYVTEKGIAPLDTGRITPATQPEYYARLADIMRRHKDDHDIWRAGRLLLSRYPVFIRHAVKQGGFWRDFMSFVEAHEKENHIILNLADAIDAAKESMAPKAKPFTMR